MANAQEYNFDHPNAFDADEIVHCLELLKTGEPVEVPEYCFKTHQRLSITRLINPSDVIIFEGILLFQVRLLPHRHPRSVISTAPSGAYQRFCRQLPVNLPLCARAPPHLAI
jgi:uridine kinase